MNVVALDVGGTFIKHALMREDAHIYAQGRVPTPRTSQKEFLACIQSILEGYQNWEGITISLPGTIDSDSGFVYQGGSLKYNAMSNLKELMQEHFACCVEIENDAHCAALCEQWLGNLQGIRNAIVLTFGTGIGGCFIINEKPYKGTHLFAGEVSILLSGDAPAQGRAAIWGPQGSVVKLVERIGAAKQIAALDGKRAFQWIQEKDPIACELFDAYCQGIAKQLFNLQLILDPQRVCIGGGASQDPIFTEGICQALNKIYDQMTIAIPRLEVMPCKYHNDSNLIGALHHYLMKHASRM